jgi:hypothetical protein
VLLCLTFEFSAYRQYNGVLIYNYCGRGFSRTDIVKATISASGGYTVGLFCTWEDMELWQVIEAIELVAELQEV